MRTVQTRFGRTDRIAVDPSDTATGDVHVDEVPDVIADITHGLIGQQPQSNPLVVLNDTRWWYIQGRGTREPVFQWTIDWTRHLATDQPPDVQRDHAFLNRLFEAGFADDRRTLRSTIY